MTTAHQQDIVDDIITDHREVEEVFAEIEKGAGGNKRDLVEQRRRPRRDRIRRRQTARQPTRSWGRGRASSIACVMRCPDATPDVAALVGPLN